MRPASHAVPHTVGDAQRSSGGPLAAVVEAAVAVGGDPTDRTAALAAFLRPADEALEVAPAADRGIWDLRSGRLEQRSIDDLLRRAEADRGTPWPQPLASGAARVHRDGDRAAWEGPALARQRRLSRSAVTAAVRLDDRWLDEVADGVQLLCEQSSWCWPAHELSTGGDGPVLADVGSPTLDLGAGEVVGQLAWLDHLLGAQLDQRYPGLRRRIRYEVRRRVVDPFIGPHVEPWRRAGRPVNNWNPWIHGHVLAAALRLLDGPDEAQLRARVVDRVIDGLDRWVAALPEDGAVDEGHDYWWAGASRALEALDLLRHATGGVIDSIPAVPALRATVRYPHQMHLGGPWRLAVADGRARGGPTQPWHELHRAARHVGDDAAAAYAAAHRDVLLREDMGLGRLLRGLTDPVWRATAPASPPLPRDVWLPSRQIMVAREHPGSSRGLTVTAKGGHNGESHNHDDVGSFTVTSDGVPVVVDAGRPTYTAQTFGPRRGELWPVQSSWHTVPEVDGTPQASGAERRAEDVVVGTDDDGSRLSLDLAAAYPVAGLTRWHRTVVLDRSRQCVEVDDEWELTDESRETTVRLLLAGRVRVGRGWARVVPIAEAAPLLIEWPTELSLRTLPRDLDDPTLSDVWGARLLRVDLVVTGRRSVSVRIRQDSGEG